MLWAKSTSVTCAIATRKERKKQTEKGGNDRDEQALSQELSAKVHPQSFTVVELEISSPSEEKA